MNYKTILVCLAILFSIAKADEKLGTSKNSKDSAKQMTVYVVRHAEAYQNLKNKKDFPEEKQDTLTDTGIKQATESATALKQNDIAAVFYSPTGRTKETAEIIAKAIGRSLRHPDLEL